MAAKPVKIVFRADASNDIGSGHVMRCLSLANALVERGAHCTFLCRELPGNMIAHIDAAGHSVETLTAPAEKSKKTETESEYAAWLGVPSADDARECKTIINRLSPDHIVLDDFALNADWVAAACSTVPVTVIDDLANRSHHCDILLDQNLGRDPADYDGLVPEKTHRLIGPKFALLRPEFAVARVDSLARRAHSDSLRSLLISMGGVDRDNATGVILDVSEKLSVCRDLKITVVMGATAPWLNQVRLRAATMPCETEILVDVKNMAMLLRDADLAIGAAGGSAWERCCMGVPTLLLTLADNQRLGAKALDKIGAAIWLGDFKKPEWTRNLVKELKLKNLTKKLSSMSEAAARITDGRGTRILANTIFDSLLRIRNAEELDSKDVWLWRNSGGANAYYLNSKETSFSDHQRWFLSALNSKYREMLILEVGNEPIAHVRFDREKENIEVFEVSMYLKPTLRGKGLGPSVLNTACEYIFSRGARTIIARVHRENVASLRVFKKVGFGVGSETGIFTDLKLVSRSFQPVSQRQ